MIREKVRYEDLNARQQEAHNFQKVSGLLADYGYITIKLSDDWSGADFIAQHWKSEDFLKVQLKGRLLFDSKYAGKNLHLAFPNGKDWYVAPYDELVDLVAEVSSFQETESWKGGKYSFPKLSVDQLRVIERFRL